jgi:hypothetical protein
VWRNIGDHYPDVQYGVRQLCIDDDQIRSFDQWGGDIGDSRDWDLSPLPSFTCMVATQASSRLQTGLDTAKPC